MKKTISDENLKDLSFVEIAKSYDKNIKFKTYGEFCNTPEADEYALTDEESNYYRERFGHGIQK